MSTARIKADIERYAEALEALDLGEYHQAERAIGLSNLNLVQLRHGCTKRLLAAWAAARGKHIPFDLMRKAWSLLVKNGEQADESIKRTRNKIVTNNR